MMKLFRLNLYIFLVLLLSGVFYFSPAVAMDQVNQTDQFRAGEFLLKFKGQDEVLRVKVDPSLDIMTLIQSYRDWPDVEYVEPNFLVSPSAFPNDPDYPKQQYLQMINIRPAWSKELLTRETENITRRSVIAVLDTGVDLDHPDLKDKIWTNIKERPGNNIDDDSNGYVDDINGWNFVENNADPNPSFNNGYDPNAISHGTIVSGIAAASINNGEGIAGVSWFSEIMPLRILDSTGSGDVYSAIKAVEYAVANGADVINMSFIGQNKSLPLETAIRRAYDKGIIVVAAAGNTDPGVDGINLDLTEYYPVCNDGTADENMVIGVASIDQAFRKSKFSNYGKCVDIVAPGENFYSAQVLDPAVSGFTSAYNGYWSGTSLSTPLVSGMVGIIKALRPQFTPKMIKDFLFSSAQNINSYNPEFKGKLGAGQLDVYKTLEAVLGESVGATGGVKQGYVVAGLGFGSFPQLKILRTDGTEFKSFYAYSPNFTGAINVATGNVNSDNQMEIVTGAGAGGGPHIRIFNREGQVLGQFFAYDQKFRGGVNLAVGDVNGDGQAEIVVGSGKGIKPEVKIFDYKGQLLSSFLAYGENFTGGVKVGVGDVNGDGQMEIVTGAGAGGGPHVRIFDKDGLVLNQFFAYNQNSTNGINVAVGDVHGDGRYEIIVSVEKNSTPTVRLFDYRGTQLLNFFAFESNFLSGVEVTAGDIDNDGIDEIITGRSFGGSPEVKIFDYAGQLKFDLFGHDQKYRGGVRPAAIIL